MQVIWRLISTGSNGGPPFPCRNSLHISRSHTWSPFICQGCQNQLVFNVLQMKCHPFVIPRNFLRNVISYEKCILKWLLHLGENCRYLRCKTFERLNNKCRLTSYVLWISSLNKKHSMWVSLFIKSRNVCWML